MRVVFKYVFILLLIEFMFTSAVLSKEKIRIVTTNTVLSDLAGQVGGDLVEVESIARGNQDPHYIEILPSYMMKVRNADIFLMIGMELELWAYQVIDGSRNAKLKVIDCSKEIEKQEVPSFRVDARYGDIHRFGNPHYWLDPMNAEKIMNALLEGLMEVSPENLDSFIKNIGEYTEKINKKIAVWSEKMEPYKGTPVIFYHNQWSYFCDRFGIVPANFLEPKPGIKPSASHVAKLIKQMNDQKIQVVIMSSFYEDRNPKLLSRATGAKLVKVSTVIDSDMGIKSYIELFDFLIDIFIKNISGK
ncbi:metal ABC transporter substrate-binding protein [candidate division KSB1 bacterium]